MKFTHVAMLLSTLVFAPLAGAASVDTNAIYDAASPPPTARCVGTTGTAVACADTSKITLVTTQIYQDCVYAGGSSCTFVRVTAPVPKTTGPVVTLQCGIDGPDADCVPSLK